jgi:predicted RecA/RadA family phage recombinase
MANDLNPFYEPGTRLTGQASAAVTGKRFVNVSANRTSGPAIPATPQVGASDPTEGGNIVVAHAAAAGPTIGVSTWDAGIGEKVGIISQGVVPVTAQGAIAAGARVEVGDTGRVRTLAAGIPVGVCLNGAADATDAEIKLQGLA